MSVAVRCLIAETADVPAILVLELRAEARAYLWWHYQIELHDAVDLLWEFAERSGLIETFGTDQVQSVISEPFARLRARAAAEEQRRDRLWAQRRPSPQPRQQARQHRTARSTEDAFFHVLRKGDAEHLAAWLADHPRDAAHLHTAWKSKCLTPNK